MSWLVTLRVTNRIKIGLVTCPKMSIGWGPFKYYVIKEVGVWGQKMAIFDDLKYCKLSKEVGGPKKVKNIPFGGTRFAFIRCL